MSGVNTKASKINRVLSRQLTINDELADIFAAVRKMHEVDQTTIQMLTSTAHRLEAENARLRKYLGSVLFERRQREMQIPTLEPSWGNRAVCACAPWECRGDASICRHTDAAR